MARYIKFDTVDSNTILVEVDEEDVGSQSGVVKAGLKDKVKDAVAAAQSTFENAVERIVEHNARAFIQAVQKLPAPPSEIEITFAIKATGELGNVAIGKIGGDANYTIKLAWKAETPRVANQLE